MFKNTLSYICTKRTKNERKINCDAAAFDIDTNINFHILFYFIFLKN